MLSSLESIAIFLLAIGIWVDDVLARVEPAYFDNLMIKILTVSSFTLISGYSIGMMIRHGKLVQYFLAGFMATFFVVTLWGFGGNIGSVVVTSGVGGIALLIYSGAAESPEYIFLAVEFGFKHIPLIILAGYSIAAYIWPILSGIV